MNLKITDLADFDFFLDEDVRSQRIGILCLEKQLTPALTQALYRVRENANVFHQRRIEKKDISKSEKIKDITLASKQLREIKWSKLNLMRSFVAQGFLKQFFHYWSKGPLPIAFFNAPFKENHTKSIDYFFEQFSALKPPAFKELKLSNSVLFVDSFTTPGGHKFEQKVFRSQNLARCYRIDSRAHDLMQLTDLLLGLTVFEQDKKTTKSKAKLNLVKTFKRFKKSYTQKNQPTFPSINLIS